MAIADGEGVIGLAGIMGGADHRGERRDAATCCSRRPIGTRPRIRRTRRALGISTEASYRFERGIDRWAGADAHAPLHRAGARHRRAASWPTPRSISGPAPSNPPRIFLRPARVTQVLGVELPWTRDRAVPGRHRRDGRLQAGRRPDRGGRAGLAARPRARDRSDRGDRAAPRLRQFPLGPAAVPARARCPTRPRKRSPPRSAAGWSEQGLYEVVTPPPRPGRWRRERPPAESALRRRCLSPPPPAPRSRAPGGGQLGQPRRGRPPLRDRDVVRRRHARRPPGGGATGRRRVSPATGSRPTGRAPGRQRFDLWDLKGRFEAAVALAIPGAAVQVEGNGGLPGTATGRIVGEAGPLAADAPPWAAPLFGFELVLDPSPRRPAPFTPLPTTPLPSGCSPFAAGGNDGGGSRRSSGAPAASCWSGSRSRATTGPRAAARHAERGVPAHLPGAGPHPARRGSGRDRVPAARRAGDRARHPAARCGRDPRRRVTWHTPTIAPTCRRWPTWSSCSAPDGGAGRLAPAHAQGGSRARRRPRRAAAWWPGPELKRGAPADRSSWKRRIRRCGSGSRRRKERLRVLSARLRSSSSMAEGTRREPRPRTRFA